MSQCYSACEISYHVALSYSVTRAPIAGASSCAAPLLDDVCFVMMLLLLIVLLTSLLYIAGSGGGGALVILPTSSTTSLQLNGTSRASISYRMTLLLSSVK
jgi:hypothetical protein